MGCFDGKSNNLRTFVDGIEYNEGSALQAALNNKYVGNYNSLRLCNSVGAPLTLRDLDITRFTQGDNTYDNNGGMNIVNGEYTYSGFVNDIIIFNKSTQ